MSKETITVIIELTGLHLKCVAVHKNRGSDILAGLLSERVKDVDDAVSSINDFIGNLSTREDIRTGRISISSSNVTILVSVPRQSVMVRLLKLPSTKLEELRSMARFQAISWVPFGENELICDILIMGIDERNGSSNILLAIARKRLDDPSLELFRKIGRFPDGFILSCIGLHQFISMTMAEKPSNYMHIDFSKDWNNEGGVSGAGWLEIDIVVENKIVSTRAVPVQLGRDVGDRVINECQQSIRACQWTNSNAPIDKVIISGCSDGETVAERIHKDFKLPVEVVDFKKNRFPLLNAETYLQSDQSKREIFNSMLSVVGSYFVESKNYINLLPQEEQERQTRQRSQKELTLAGFWLGLLAVILVSLSGWKVIQMKKHVSVLDSKILKLEPDAKKVAGLFEKAAFLKGQMNLGASSLETLREIHRLVPSSIVLNSLSYDAEGSLSLQGTARKFSEIVELVNHLERSPLFSKAELRASSTRTIRKADYVDFQVQCFIEVKVNG